jgi:hypothetical protein
MKEIILEYPVITCIGLPVQNNLGDHNYALGEVGTIKNYTRIIEKGNNDGPDCDI